MFNILIVEDDKNIRKLMKVRLESNNYHVYSAENGEVALSILENHPIDLIIADIMMPQMDGYEMMEIVRSSGNQIPVIMVTAKQTIEDKIKGYQVGIDDYMVKPINHSELLLRVEAILRRTQIANDRKIIIGKVELNYNSLTISKNDFQIMLPKKEFYILFKLLSYPNQIFTKVQLMNEFWGYYSDSDDNTIKVHINRIRNKIKNFKEFDIITVRGLGYKGVKYEG